jgi:hypothetical protein
MVPSATRLPARDLLFASSLIMTCVGLLPLLEFARRAQSTPLATAVVSRAPPSSLAELLPLALAALTPVDRSALVVCGVVSVLGVGLLVLQLAPPLAAVSTLRALRLATVGVAAAVAVAAVVLALALATDAAPVKPTSLWHSEQFAASEHAFEQQVNDLYCHAKGQHVCDLGSIADARQVFPIRQWPVGTDSQPGKRVAASCEGFAPTVQQWGYPGKMEVCRMCANIRAHRELLAAATRRRHPHETTDPVAELLQVVPRLSVGEQMWCGEYLTQLSSTAAQAADASPLAVPPKMPVGAGQSPFRTHRAAFRELLGPAESPRGRSLQSAARALQVLLVASAVSGVALCKWMAQLAALGVGHKKLAVDE